MAIYKLAGRINHHTTTTGVPFTVPVSVNFTDGSWIPSDLARSEFGVDEANTRLFIRIENTIQEVQLTNSNNYVIKNNVHFDTADSNNIFSLEPDVNFDVITTIATLTGVSNEGIAFSRTYNVSHKRINSTEFVDVVTANIIDQSQSGWDTGGIISGLTVDVSAGGLKYYITSALPQTSFNYKIEINGIKYISI